MTEVLSWKIRGGGRAHEEFEEMLNRRGGVRAGWAMSFGQQGREVEGNSFIGHGGSGLGWNRKLDKVNVDGNMYKVDRNRGTQQLNYVDQVSDLMMFRSCL